jgi:hypothetical protein
VLRGGEYGRQAEFVGTTARDQDFCRDSASIEFVAVAEAHSWSWPFSLSSDPMYSLREVRGLIHLWNGHPIRAPHTCIALASVLPREAEVSLERKIPAGRFWQTQATLASDASDSAVASFCNDRLPAFDLFSSLTEEEKLWSSSCRELIALQRTLDAKADLLSSKGPVTLWWLTDNSNVAKFLAKGSGKLVIMLQILDLLRTAWSLFLDLRPVWVSWDHPLLQRANARSKSIDTDNWSVWPVDFDFLFHQFGPFTVNLFASAENAKVERFFSFAFEDGCSAVDAFACDWAGERAYAAPPVVEGVAEGSHHQDVRASSCPSVALGQVLVLLFSQWLAFVQRVCVHAAGSVEDGELGHFS